MKRLTFFTFLLSISFCYAQEILYMGKAFSTINFEDTVEYKYVGIDTKNVWRIAEPHKEILFIPQTHSYLGKYAIISDTNRFYNSNIRASFQFRLFLGEGDSYGISFSQKYDFEKNKDGGIIETSYDNGVTWQNIIFDTIIQNNIENTSNLYGIADKISSLEDQPGFSGLQSDIQSVSITFGADELIRGDIMLLKFSLGTDSNDAQNEGWMLDDFKFSGIETVVIESSINKTDVKIYPNPVKNVLKIESEDVKITDVKILSISGKKLLEKSGYDIRNIDMTGFHSGMYLVICKTDNDILRTFKIQRI
ncbi:MAG: T9SS type A sorting domain-containing protein [Bacteroidales bacterium]|nr:T9SS type A sorting domain-containing protein [Bacteroidales bacterium]